MPKADEVVASIAELREVLLGHIRNVTFMRTDPGALGQPLRRSSGATSAQVQSRGSRPCRCRLGIPALH